MPDEPFIHYPDERQPAQVRPGHPSPAHDQEHEQPVIPPGLENLLAAVRLFEKRFHGGNSGYSAHADAAWPEYRDALLNWRDSLVRLFNESSSNGDHKFYRDRIAQIDWFLTPIGKRPRR